MFRRAVSLLLLPLVLISQSAALGHAHCAWDAVGHELRPHFHAHLTFCEQGHWHEDEADGQCHHDTRGASAGQEFSVPSDHESDAVYLNQVDAVVRLKVADDDGASSAGDAAYGSPSVGIRLTVERDCRSRTPPPRRRESACPLYLHQLALRI